MSVERDPIFGEVKYDYGWRKFESLDIWGENHKIEIVANAYNGQEITPIQQKAYQWFKNSLSDVFEDSLVRVIEYAMQNKEDLVRVGIQSVNNEAIINHVKPTTVLFIRDQDSEVIGILFNCSWEPEDGLAVKIKNQKIIDVGLQDIVL